MWSAGRCSLAVRLQVHRTLGHLARFVLGRQLREIVAETARRIVGVAQLQELRVGDRELQLLPARQAEEAGMEVRDVLVGEGVLAAAVRTVDHHGCSYGDSLSHAEKKSASTSSRTSPDLRMMLPPLGWLPFRSAPTGSPPGSVLTARAGPR